MEDVRFNISRWERCEQVEDVRDFTWERCYVRFNISRWERCEQVEDVRDFTYLGGKGVSKWKM